jgi:hypothetical protein
VGVLLGAVLLGGTLAGSARAQTLLDEGFDTVLPAGWTTVNNSSPLGSISWFQGNSAVFPAFDGATNAYIGVNFNSGSGVSTLNNWLITPALALNNGDTVSFFTRTVDTPAFPDRLELRLNSLNTLNVGTTATTVGDFTTLLTSVNPTLTASGYPSTWTQITASITGLSGPTTARLALRYTVPNGGPNGANSDYIGVDRFKVVSNAVVAPEPASLALFALALPLVRRRRKGA